jgi:hypothetical protein
MPVLMCGRRRRFIADPLRSNSMEALQSTPVSPGWAHALPPGPDTRVKITEEYAALVARDAYFWAWPLVNIYNRRLVMAQVKEAVRAGPLVFAPLNRNAMFTDYVDPEERSISCPPSLRMHHRCRVKRHGTRRCWRSLRPRRRIQS